VRQAHQIRQKPHRLPREIYRGEVTVSITMCVEGRVPLFENAEVVAAFVEILNDVAGRWSCLVLVYCFMPDHLHIAIHGRTKEADAWRMAVDFKQRSGFWLYKHVPGASWQKDFHDHVVRQSEDLIAHLRYVLDNPVRWGLVGNWEEYAFKGSIGCTLEEAAAL